MLAEMNFDVIVVGSGPGGLCAALAVRCALPEARIGIFEKASAFRQVGAAIGFQANGQSALAAISPAALETVLASGSPYNSMKLYGGTGELLADRPSTGMLLIAWYQVQAALLQVVRADPAMSVHLSKPFSRYEEDEGGVTVAFEDGTQARCSVLVGADGARSAVRAQCLGDAPAMCTGLQSTRAILAQCPAWWPNPNSVSIFSNQFMVLPLMGGRLAWGSQQPATEMPAYAEGAREEVLKSRALAAFAAWPADVRRLIQESPSEGLLEFPLFGREGQGPLPHWGHGRVTLLGDAAHVVHPNLGQGTSMAVEDAVVLGHALSEHGLGTHALRQYEDSRAERVQFLADVTHSIVSHTRGEMRQEGRPDAASLPPKLSPERLKEVGRALNDLTWESVRPRAAATRAVAVAAVRPARAAAAGRATGPSSALRPRAAKLANVSVRPW